MNTRRAEMEILGIGMVTPVGLSARQTAASVRTGIGRLAESYATDRCGEMMVMGLCDLAELPPLIEDLDDPDDPAQELSPRQERLARLAGPALVEAMASDVHTTRPMPLLLALPEPHAGASHAVGPEMIAILEAQTGRWIDTDLSRSYPLGRAGLFTALADALALLAARGPISDREDRPARGGPLPLVLVGAVDSYLDLGLLQALDEEGRLKTGEISDGFVPGEGAAFVLLGGAGSAARRGQRPIARITAVGRAHEPGHLYSDQPHRGDGLSVAFAALFAAARAHAPKIDVGCVYAGLNGESYWAKEWGVAQVRGAGHLRERLRIEHPADCFGDAGAALPLIMLGLGALELSRERIDGDCLVWGGADRGERGAALLAR